MLLGAVTLTLAQSTIITGKVVDENGLAMPGATILISDLEQVGAYSDRDGYFTMYNVPAGDHTVKVTYIGYKEMTQDVSADGSLVNLSFQLDPGVSLGTEVIILGDRLKGQAKAINKQKNNQNITNIVAADQIGRFPDANVGDAMKRIPGITMQGDQGEARNIIIRGLQPQLNSIMINGNRIPSAEGDNRNIQMDLIPADMIQTIEVNKAVTPDMDADAIGGSVNLVTRSASSGMRLSGTAASGYNLLSEKPIWTGGVVVSNRFLDDKLGVVLSGSYNNHDFGSDNIEAEWDEGDNGAFVSSFEHRIYEVQRIRRSISLGLDYEINPSHKLYVNGMYNHRDDWENRYRTVLDGIGEPGADGVSFVEKIERQTKGGVGSDRVDFRRLEDQRVSNIGFGGDHLLGKVKLNWQGAWSRASENRPNERYAQYVFEPEVEVDGDDEPQGILFDQDLSNPRKPLFTGVASDGFSVAGNDPSILDYSAFEIDELTEEFQDTYETDFNGRIDLKIPVNTKGIVQVGGRIRSKEKVRDNAFFEYSFLNDEFETLDQVPLTNKTDSGFEPGGQYVAGDYASSTWLGNLDLNNASRFEEEDKPDEYLSGNYEANEGITAAYTMITYDVTETFAVLAGARVEHTSIEYTGNEVEDEENLIREISSSKSYTNFLPGIHLKYNFIGNLIARAAWTNTLARPNYFDLVPYVDRRVDELFLGNPDLDPTTSSNFDLSVENYFQSIGLVSAGFFHKSIQNFIFPSLSTEAGTDFQVLQPQNGEDASINGFELAAQRQLDFLPGLWKGIGIYINYTYTSSDANGLSNEDGYFRDDINLPGTAENLFNASLSFETEKIVFRASVNHSSDYIDEVGESAFFDRYYDKQTFVDLNASYAFTPKWRVFFEANNITNQPLRFYQGAPSRTMQEEFYNARFNLGIKFDSFGN